ncbi:MAG: helix-turn-helix transcriptional regulator [Clostridia bacterium]|nr:helix-turn-helix transcriptional regulator [Clostridia bacterium]
MIFDQDNLQFQLLDVLWFDESNVAYRTRARTFFALSLRMEGDTDVELRGRDIHFTAGDLACFPPNTEYTRRSRRDIMIVFHFYVQDYVSYELDVLHDMEHLLPMFRDALHEWQERRPGYRYRAAALLYSIFAQVYAARNPTPSAHPQNLSPTVAEGIRYLRANFADPGCNVEALAEHLHMSETYVRRLFMRDLGVSPKRCLSDLRMERAQSLLNAGYDTVAAVAEQVGFRDAKNFATAFKKRFGYPPSAQTYGM